MNYINCILTRLHLFFLSPIFPFLLSLIIFILLKSLGSPHLCMGANDITIPPSNTTKYINNEVGVRKIGSKV